MDELPGYATDFLRNYIARGEAPTYNTLYGGRKFSSYADHPGVSKVISSGPNAGKTSSAAGLYQFLYSTWKEQQKRLGLPDFSPKSQDLAAWDLAQRNFKARTGQDLSQLLAQQGSGAWGVAGRALNNIWTSLPGGIEQAGRSFMNKAREVDARRRLAALDPLGNAGAAGAGGPVVARYALPPPPDPLMSGLQDMNDAMKRQADAPVAVYRRSPMADTVVDAMQPRNLILGGGSSSFGAGV